MSGGCSGGSCSTGSCQSDEDRLPPGMLSRYDLDQDTGLGTLIWAETTDSGIDDSVIRLISRIRSNTNDRIFAMITGPAEIRPLYDVLFSYGVDTIYHVRSKALEDYDADLYSDALSDIAKRIDPMFITLSATKKGDEVAKLTGSRLGRDVTIDAHNIPDIDDVMTVEDPRKGSVSTVIGHARSPIITTVDTSGFDVPKRIEGRKGTVISRPFTASRT